jgi:hypothetical protein
VITIEVYADIWCPFAHVSLMRAAQQRDETGSDVRFRVFPWPLELINKAAMDPDFIGEEVQDLQAQATPDLFADFSVDAFPSSTLPALALVEAAYRTGVEQGEAMSLATRAALFEYGHDLDDPAVLERLAQLIDVPMPTNQDMVAIGEAWAAGQARAVVGSPHYFTPAGDFFCPALDIKRVDEHLVIKPIIAAFDKFINAELT